MGEIKLNSNIKTDVTSIEFDKRQECEVDKPITSCKSLEFIKNRIRGGDCYGIETNDFESPSVYHFDESLKYLLKPEILAAFKNSTINLSGDRDGVKTSISINYDPIADFDYFTMESCVCDGTLIFFNDLMSNILQKLFTGSTYCKTKVPSDINSNPKPCILNYTVGDFVLNGEYGDFGTKEKPWMHSRFTAMLPIKFDYAEI